MVEARPLVLVTGADGFVGTALCRRLLAAGYGVRGAVRSVEPRGADTAIPRCAVGDIGAQTDWAMALAGANVVVHLAARTHVMRETAGDALAEYRRINVAATRRLAEQAAHAGVRRLVFLSSIKVNGEATHGRPFSEDDPPRPEDAYGMTKWEAEQALQAAATGCGMETVVLRPPLVYGAHVRGNFLRLMAAVARGTPLPFASLRNRRSLVYVDNLAEAIIAALANPRAAGRTYLVCDDEDVSTPALVRKLACALGVAPRLLPCPAGILRAAAALAGRSAAFARLAGSLAIDASRIRRELSWRPGATLEQGLAATARWYRETTSRSH